MSVHTIPVPPGWSVEQSWERISRGERLPADYPEQDAGWAAIEVEGLTTRIADDGVEEVTGGRLVRVCEPDG